RRRRRTEAAPRTARARRVRLTPARRSYPRCGDDRSADAHPHHDAEDARHDVPGISVVRVPLGRATAPRAPQTPEYACRPLKYRLTTLKLKMTVAMPTRLSSATRSGVHPRVARACR